MMTLSEILFTMNVDTQEVNIVVDKDNIEVQNDIVDSGNIVEQPIKHYKLSNLWTLE